MPRKVAYMLKSSLVVIMCVSKSLQMRCVKFPSRKSSWLCPSTGRSKYSKSVSHHRPKWYPFRYCEWKCPFPTFFSYQCQNLQMPVSSVSCSMQWRMVFSPHLENVKLPKIPTAPLKSVESMCKFDRLTLLRSPSSQRNAFVEVLKVLLLEYSILVMHKGLESHFFVRLLFGSGGGR